MTGSKILFLLFAVVVAVAVLSHLADTTWRDGRSPASEEARQNPDKPKSNEQSMCSTLFRLYQVSRPSELTGAELDAMDYCRVMGRFNSAGETR